MRVGFLEDLFVYRTNHLGISYDLDWAYEIGVLIDCFPFDLVFIDFFARTFTFSEPHHPLLVKSRCPFTLNGSRRELRPVPYLQNDGEGESVISFPLPLNFFVHS
jgi:hypothetical protein